MDSPFSLPRQDLQLSMNLLITCEFTIRWPCQVNFRRLQDMSWSSDYLWIHDRVAHSTNYTKIWKDLKTSADLQITGEFTIRGPRQLILRRLEDISWSSVHLWIHDQVAHSTNLKTVQKNLKTSADLQITCEFTIMWPIQLMLRRVQDMSLSSVHLWIHDQVARSTNLKTIQKELKTSADLQITCEFTIRWPSQVILRRIQDISWSSDYLWTHDWMGHSTHAWKILRCQRCLKINGLPVNSQVCGLLPRPAMTYHNS